MKNSKNSQIEESSNDIAIAVRNVSKAFRVPHRKMDSVKNAFVNIFAPNTYEEFNALNNISFDVKKGEFLGIIGRNGAGKSTLLKTLAGIYRPDRGEITINGRISPFLELGIGFNPELSGRDNVYLNATVLGLTKKDIDKKFDEIVAFAELEEFIDQQLKNYSSGMQARLAFSVSIHADREILLMDEVLAVGDSNFQQKCLDIFKGYKDVGKTVVLVTHNMSTVREYCDRALLFHKGELIESGSVDEVCDQYIIKNLSDDERKEMQCRENMERKEKERVEELRENKDHFIVSIIPYDETGAIVTKTMRDSALCVEVKIYLKEVPDNIFLAVQIYDRNRDFFVCGNNTDVDQFDCGWHKGENIIRLTFPSHQLNLGDIYFRANLLQRKGNERTVIDQFSSKEYGFFVSIQNKNSGAGIMYMEHKWERVIEN